MNPGPHGPEIYAISSTETVFAGFEFVSRTHRMIPGQFHAEMAPGLLHELLHCPSVPDGATDDFGVLGPQEHDGGNAAITGRDFVGETASRAPPNLRIK